MATVVEYRPNGLARVAAVSWIVVLGTLVPLLLVGELSWFYGVFPLMAPWWIVVAMRSRVVLSSRGMVADRGFRTIEDDLTDVTSRMRGMALGLERDGELVVGTNPSQSPWVDGVRQHDAEVVAIAVRQVLVAARRARADG